MSETVQLPGNLPPGATDDTFLTVEEFGTWVGLAPRTVQDQIRAGRVPAIRGSQGMKRRIHVGTFKARALPGYKAMRGAL